MVKTVRNAIAWAALIAILLFIFGPLLGLRESRTEARSRRIHEEHERRQQESREISERESKRTQETLERARKELFGGR